MVFTLVSAGQEWLNEKWDSIKREKEEKVLAKIRADEEAEQVNCFIISIHWNFYHLLIFCHILSS